jgi:Putative peptidoglycan binding domain
VRTIARFRNAAVALALLLPVAIVEVVAVPAAATPQGATQAPVQLDLPTDMQRNLHALDVLHSYGYTVDTPAHAARAIRHWQRVNGLVIDGVIGPQTLASLNISATASLPAVRVSPPASTGRLVPVDENVEQIIRDVWPDELEDHALAIATRESRLVPTARNACCWGLFQLHWRAHRSWLVGMGITDPAQLLDARTNATAALALYQQAGWSPWSL